MHSFPGVVGFVLFWVTVYYAFSLLEREHWIANVCGVVLVLSLPTFLIFIDSSTDQ